VGMLRNGPRTCLVYRMKINKTLPLVHITLTGEGLDDGYNDNFHTRATHQKKKRNAHTVCYLRTPRMTAIKRSKLSKCKAGSSAQRSS